MKVINQSEGDRIRYAVVDDDGATLNWFGGRVGFIKTDPDRIVEERAEAWRDGYVSGLNDGGYDTEHWRAEAERWRAVADNAASDHAQADTDSLRALHERNELRRQLAAESKRAEDNGKLAHDLGIRLQAERALADRLGEGLQAIADWAKSGPTIPRDMACGYLTAWREARNATPGCPKCGRSTNMMNHDGEWVCHSTHAVD